MAHTYEHKYENWEQDMETLGNVIIQIKKDADIDWIGVDAWVVENITYYDPSVPAEVIGIYMPNLSGVRWILIEAAIFNEAPAELLWLIYHEVAHAITHNLYGPYNAHKENFQDTLEDLVEAGFTAGTLTQSDLDYFEQREEGYNPNNVDRSDYRLNDESDAIQDWLAENNPHEAGTPLAERWETIQKGDDVSEIEEEIFGDLFLREWFDIESGGDNEITPDDFLENNFDEVDLDGNGIINWDEYDYEYYVPVAHEDDIAPYMLDVNMDGEINISDAIDVLREIVGLEELSDTEFVLADANRDGVVNISDAITTLRVIVGLETVESLADDFFVPALDIT